MLLLACLALLPSAMLLHLAWAEMLGLESRLAQETDWGFACSAAAVDTTRTGDRAEAIRALHPGETATWRWEISTPAGAFSSTLTATGDEAPWVRGVCAHDTTVATTRARLRFAPEERRRADIFAWTWVQCGVRRPCVE